METHEPLVAIKGKFQAPKESYYALFLFIVNPDAGYIETANIVISRYSELYQTELQYNWREIENKIQELKYHNQYAPLVTNDLQQRLKNLTTNQDFFLEIMKCLRANAIAQLEKMLLMIFRRAMRDEDLSIEIKIETFDLVEPDTTTQPTLASEPVTKPIESTGVTLPVTLVLAPIGGKPVTELKPGDTIMVRIVPLNEKANFFIDTMKLREDKTIKPCPMVLETLQPTENGLLLKGRLDENLYGTVTETEKVLVQLYQAPAATKTKKEKKESLSATPTHLSQKVTELSQGNSKLPLILSSAVALLLLFLLAYMLTTL